MIPNQDSRKYIRHEVIDFALITCLPSQRASRALVVDVGLGGLSLRTKDSFNADQKVSVLVGQGGEPPIEIHGQIRHVRKQSHADTYSVGIQFQPKNNAERARVASLINVAFQRSSFPTIA